MSSSSSKIVSCTASGHHLLKIEGYSHTQSALLSGQRALSAPFTVGGHQWTIGYYPNGVTEYFRRYISLYLFLSGCVNSPVTARVQFTLASAEDERLGSKETKTKPSPIKSGEAKSIANGKWACRKFIKRADLERSKHLMDDSFTVRCDIIVTNGFHAEAGSAPDVPVPRASVTVPNVRPGPVPRWPPRYRQRRRRHVRGGRPEVRRAPLAARGAVPVVERRAPGTEWSRLRRGARGKNGSAVLQGGPLLHVHGPLSLPETTTTKQDQVAFAQHLLVAAHRYGVERLNLLCEERLCKSLDIGTAADILAFAEPLGCHQLKDA